MNLILTKIKSDQKTYPYIENDDNNNENNENNNNDDDDDDKKNNDFSFTYFEKSFLISINFVEVKK